MKKTTKFMALFLSLVMLLCTMPIYGFAANPPWAQIWVGGVQMAKGYYLSESDTEIRTTVPEDGFAYLAEDGVTLTLHDYNIEDLGYYNGNYNYGIYSRESLNIILEGTNSIKGTSSFFYSIRANTGTLSVKGNSADGVDSLSLSSSRLGMSSSKDLLITDCSIDSYAALSSAIFSSLGNVIITDSTVNARTSAKEAAISVNSSTDKDIIINNSTITASSTRSAFEKEPVLNFSGNYRITAGNSKDSTTEVLFFAGYNWVKIEPVDLPYELASVWVGGVRMGKGTYLAEGASEPTSVAPADNYAFLALDGKTLTLHNYDYTGKGYWFDSYFTDEYSGIWSYKDLDVILEGPNSIKSDFTGFYGIFSDSGSLTVRGNISDGEDSYTFSGYYPGLYAYSDISIYDCNININSTSKLESCTAIFCYDNFSISNSTVIAQCKYGVFHPVPTLNYTNGYIITAGDDEESAVEVEAIDMDQKWVRIDPVKVHVHTVAIDPAIAPTCTESGLSEGSHCSACGEVIVAQQVVAPLGHSFGEWEDAENGTHLKTCSVCGETETEEHVYGDWHYNKDGKLFKNGTKSKSCDVCGCVVTEKAEYSAWICHLIYPFILLYRIIFH